MSCFWGTHIKMQVFLLSHCHAAEYHRSCRKRSLNCLSPPEADEFSSSRKLRGTQGILPTAGQVTGGLFFWFVFFGQAKKMNNMTAFSPDR